MSGLTARRHHVGPRPDPLYRDPTAPVETRVRDLLSRMTLREKAGQLNQRMYGWDAYRRTPDGGFGLTEALYAETDRFEGLGALYGLQRADAWSGVDHTNGPGAQDGAALAELVQRHVVERSRLGIPALFVEEVPHGHMALDGTSLPVNLAVGATWDPGLCERAAAHAAAELRARGGHVALVSALDIARDPRWGRTEECFGEDPYLAARLTEAVVRGIQGEPAAYFAADKAPVVLKHFAGQGATVGGRNSAESELGPRELHEIHLPAARAGVRAGAAAVMAAYNEVDGLPCAGNRALLTGLLRERWGFEGLVMADGLAVDRLARITGDTMSAGALALDAGVDLSLWDVGFTQLAEAVERGLVAEEVLDSAVARVLRLKFRLGLFDQEAETGAGTTRFPSNGREVSTLVARAAVTLLHDDGGVLPVSAAVSRLAVLGPQSATAAHQLGDYTAPQRPGTAVSVLDGLRRLAPPGLDIRHAPGCALTGDDLSAVPAAVAAAAASDLAVLVLGGSSARTPDTEFDANGAARTVVSEMTCGEGVDLAGLRLGKAQNALLEAVVATGTPTVVVLIQGRPHVVAATGAAALLTAWYPGPWGGDAIAEVLLGLAEPVGRLPVSVPRSAAQLPVHYNHKDTEYGGYADEDAEPLYSFGHGLSYTSFAYGRPQLSGHAVEVDITNTGRRAGRSVAQLYLRRLRTPVWPRTLELCGFQAVDLAPGETRTVTFPLGAGLPGRGTVVEFRVAESARAALTAVPTQSFTAPEDTPL